jgi:hypothetical protein
VQPGAGMMGNPAAFAGLAGARPAMQQVSALDWAGLSVGVWRLWVSGVCGCLASVGVWRLWVSGVLQLLLSWLAGNFFECERQNTTACSVQALSTDLLYVLPPCDV